MNEKKCDKSGWATAYLKAELKKPFKQKGDQAFFQGFKTNDGTVIDRGQKGESFFKTIILQPGHKYQIDGTVAAVHNGREQISYRWVNIADKSIEYGANGGYASGESGGFVNGGSGSAWALIDLTNKTEPLYLELQLDSFKDTSTAEYQCPGTRLTVRTCS